MEKFLIAALAFLCLLFGLGALKQACESHTRKSKPPIKIKHPDEIKDRKDICYDAERNTATFSKNDVQVEPQC